MTQPVGNGAFVEQAGIVVAVKHQPILRLHDVQEDIEVDEALWIGVSFGLEAVELHVAAHPFEIELHLGQRQTAGIAWNLQLSDQATVGVVLVLVTSQHSLLHLRQEPRGSSIRGRLPTQRNEVDAVSNQHCVYHERLPGSGNSDDDIVLTAQAAQKNLEVTEACDEQGTFLLRSKLLDGVVGIGSYSCTVGGPLEFLHCGPWPIRL